MKYCKILLKFEVDTKLNSVKDAEYSDQQIGSLIDTWIITKLAVGDGRRSRVLYVLKSRGMSHSPCRKDGWLSAEWSYPAHERWTHSPHRSHATQFS